LVCASHLSHPLSWAPPRGEHRMSETAASELLNGSCLCRGVMYEIRGGVGNLSHYHCSMCRKAHGAAFGTYAPVAWSAFCITQGERLVRRYQSSPSVTRTFCSVCGSTMQYIPDGGGHFFLAVGTLDSDPVRRPRVQIWVRDKAPWWDIDPKLPSYQTDPPHAVTP
jgi:hypothetical protein